MSQIAGLNPNVIGVLLVGAEGVSETEGQSWLREATDEETKLFVEDCRNQIRESRGAGPASEFSLGSYSVDNNNRPYWLMAVLVHPETPDEAKRKALEYSRVMRLVD